MIYIAPVPTIGLCWFGESSPPNGFFNGWNQKEFNYCPSGTWEDWVKFANEIIAIDKASKRPGDDMNPTIQQETTDG